MILINHGRKPGRDRPKNLIPRLWRRATTAAEEGLVELRAFLSLPMWPFAVMTQAFANQEVIQSRCRRCRIDKSKAIEA